VIAPSDHTPVPKQLDKTNFQPFLLISLTNTPICKPLSKALLASGTKVITILYSLCECEKGTIAAAVLFESKLQGITT